jgi:predicted RNA-binding protein with PUA-like domain
MKSEPDCYSYDDLEKEPSGKGHWEGVRNFQARNFMKNDRRIGDGVLFYHSSCPVPGVAGVAEVVSEPYPDHTQFDPKSEYFDSTSRRERPKWYMVDVSAREKFKNFVPLQQLRETDSLSEMVVLRRGNRLSITPVTADEWKIILKLGR